MIIHCGLLIMMASIGARDIMVHLTNAVPAVCICQQQGSHRQMLKHIGSSVCQKTHCTLCMLRYIDKLSKVVFTANIAVNAYTGSTTYIWLNHFEEEARKVYNFYVFEAISVFYKDKFLT